LVNRKLMLRMFLRCIFFKQKRVPVQSIEKNDSLYNAFNQSVFLKIQLPKIESDINDVYSKNYIFCKVEESDKFIKRIKRR
jgi:hypothetical protein